jgi:hypothetical protein
MVTLWNSGEFSGILGQTGAPGKSRGVTTDIAHSGLMLRELRYQLGTLHLKTLLPGEINIIHGDKWTFRTLVSILNQCHSSHFGKIILTESAYI